MTCSLDALYSSVFYVYIYYTCIYIYILYIHIHILCIVLCIVLCIIQIYERVSIAQAHFESMTGIYVYIV